MFCPKCGTENTDTTAKFCKNCGHQLPTGTSPADEPKKKLRPTINVAGPLMLAVIIVVAGIVIYSLVGGEAGPYGKYVNRDNSDEYLELRQDGTFYLKEMGVGFTGEWEMKEDVLRLYLSELGLAVEGRLEGGKIVDDDGKVWVRTSALPQDASTSLQGRIIGKWEKIAEPEVVLEFSRDGTLNAVDSEASDTVERMGSYEFIDSDTIRMTLLNSESAVVDIRISDSGDTLTLSLGSTLESYRRVQ